MYTVYYTLEMPIRSLKHRIRDKIANLTVAQWGLVKCAVSRTGGSSVVLFYIHGCSVVY